MSNIEIVGLMSGTSLDGLDIAHVRFAKNNDQWTFDLLNTESEGYSDGLKKELKNAPELPSAERAELDVRLGKEFAKRVNTFLTDKKIDKKNIACIASHGHTVLHQPQNGFSLQIGCGDTIAKETGIDVVNDFRNKDISVGGQGAPLVPIGDKLLFSGQAQGFLNLGGFCNITFQNKQGEWTAFDIAPCNLPMNKLAEVKGQDYDKGGELARAGKVNEQLLEQLNNLSFYKKTPPKSLGTEWLESEFLPLLDFSGSVENNIRTVLEHVAIQIAQTCQQNNLSQVFATGGGVFNEFLIERMEHHLGFKLNIPDKEIVEYKEALIFAFLGALYLKGEPSNVPSATGAKEEVTLGVLHKANV